MRFPVSDKLPLLKFRILSKIYLSMYSFVTRIANSFNVFHNIISSIFINMVCNKTSFYSSFRCSTQFAKEFSEFVRLLTGNSSPPVTIRFTISIYQIKCLFCIFLSEWRSRLAKIRTIFIHSSKSNLITWRSKLLETSNTFENKLSTISLDKICLRLGFGVCHNIIISRSMKEVICVSL